MAIRFDIPQSPTTYTYSFTDFLGVDLNDPFDCDVRHSPNMRNMILENGYLKKRHGLKIKMRIDNAPIHGIWNYDVPGDTEFNEIFLVHCGTKLYEVDKNFTFKSLLMSNLNNKDSWGMFLGDKLVILDGKRAIVYGKYGNNYTAQYMDQVAYIPTTTIGLSPQGYNGTSYESANSMTAYRINLFLADGTSTEYFTDSYSISPNAGDTLVWILNENTGAWDLQPQNSYSVVDNKKIVFNTAPPASPVEGRDNVKIQFKSTTVDIGNVINKCTFCVPFGYQGNNQRLFFSGNPEQPNVDWHSDLVASQPDPTYVPDDSFAVIGSQPIVGYLRLSDGTLAILKGLSDTDCSIYYRTSNAQGRWDIFPLLSGTKNVGCLTPYSCLNVQNNSMFLSELGVFQAVTGEASSTLERYADNKSYYVNKVLMNEANLDKAKAVSLGELYYLFVNTKLYICDTSKLTQPKNSNILQYQWWPCDLSTNITAATRWNNQAILGDSNGYIKMFGDDYIDEISIDYTTDLPSIVSQDVDCYFETVPIDFSTSSTLRSVKAKTTRNFTLNYIAPETSKFEFGYKTIDEEKVESEEIYKIVDESFDNDLSEYVYLPYGTKLVFDENVTHSASNDGIVGMYYGTQTDEIKTIFGYYINEGIVHLGSFTYNTETEEVEMIKEIYNSEEGYKLHQFICKKKLDLLHVFDVNNPIISTSGPNAILIVDPTLNGVPQTITIKEKARKIMFLKFYVESIKYACEFDRIFIDFRMAGKYRGE